MEESILRKDGMNLLFEEAVVEKAFDEEMDDAKNTVITKIEKIDGSDKSEIIELRNEPTISKIADVNKFISIQMKSLGNLFFDKEVCFNTAYTTVFKINLVLHEKYSLKDLFINAKIEKDGENLVVKYDNVNLDLINKFKTRLEYYATACHDCLFNDLYDFSTLSKYLPIVYFLASYTW